MRFGILGPTRVRLADGRDVAVRGPRLRALLALLLVDAGRLVSTERLIDGVYGANPPAGAANALQSQVSRLRLVLSDEAGQRPVVEFHPAGYRLAIDRDQVDAHRFTRLAAEGRRALAAGAHERAAMLLREALDLWRGAPLADVLDAPFAAAEAARLEELRLGALEDHVEAQLGLGAYEALVPEVRALVAAHPLRERLHAQLMRALHGSGRRAEALAAFERARRVLADELGAGPSAALAAVHLAVLRDDEPPAPATPAKARLPSQLTSLVGREDDLRRIGKSLDQARLVTLHGSGGVGKTRLAVEAAARTPGDVCFVELAELDSGAEVPGAVLHALGLREAGLRAPAADPRGATDRLVSALADRRLLLVLDNCEHLVADVARLAARILAACAEVRILATSREPLGLTGEALCPVSGLARPPAGTTAATAWEYPAVRLFADRALDVVPDFGITPANVESVQAICDTLDGLPLAIELAAARLRALPVSEIAARLDDRFRLLSRGSRTAPARHRTLRAVVEWSWDLLDDAERVLARRLTVFSGGATLDGVERVCGVPARDVVDALSGLVDKSLVEVVAGRYRMLDTVRSFCVERLVDAGEEERLRRLHAAYFLDLAQAADPHLRRAEQLEWLRRLDAERDNLHAALRAALSNGDTDTALQLVAALAFYWWLRGLRHEAAARAGELAGLVGDRPPPGLEEEYAACLLTASLARSAADTPHRAAGSPESILSSLGRPPRQPFLLFLAAMVAGPPTGGSDTLAAATEGAGALIGTDPWGSALARLGLGLARLLDGRAEPAQRELAAALGGFRALGDRWGIVVVLGVLAESGLVRDGGAGTLLDEALRLAGELESTVDIADLLRIRGDGQLRAGDLDRAHVDYARAVELARQAGAPEVAAAAGAGLGEIAQMRGDLGAARRICEAALAECPAGWFGADAIRTGILVSLGRIAMDAGDAVSARTWYRGALVAGAARTAPGLDRAIEGLVAAELAGGDGRRAALLLGAARALLPYPAAGPATGSPATGSPAVAEPGPMGPAAPGGVDLARVERLVRDAVGESAYESAFRRGAAMTREQVLDMVSG